MSNPNELPPLPSNEDIYKGMIGTNSHRPETFDHLPDPLSPIFPGQLPPETPPEAPQAQGVPNPAETPTEAPQTTPEAPENTFQLEPLPPELVAKYEGLETYLEHRLGAPLDNIIELLTSLSGFQQQTTVEQQRGALQTEWGVDKGEFDRRLKLIQDELKTMPESAQASFDTVEGAKKIWGYISAAQAQVQPVAPNVPVMVRSQVRGGGGQSYDYRQSDIRAMSPSDYSANADRITQAYMTRRVLLD